MRGTVAFTADAVRGRQRSYGVRPTQDGVDGAAADRCGDIESVAELGSPPA